MLDSPLRLEMENLFDVSLEDFFKKFFWLYGEKNFVRIYFSFWKSSFLHLETKFSFQVTRLGFSFWFVSIRFHESSILWGKNCKDDFHNLRVESFSLVTKVEEEKVAFFLSFQTFILVDHTKLILFFSSFSFLLSNLI